jgi:hypothetical protein
LLATLCSTQIKPQQELSKKKGKKKRLIVFTWFDSNGILENDGEKALYILEFS